VRGRADCGEAVGGDQLGKARAGKAWVGGAGCRKSLFELCSQKSPPTTHPPMRLPAHLPNQPTHSIGYHVSAARPAAVPAFSLPRQRLGLDPGLPHPPAAMTLELSMVSSASSSVARKKVQLPAAGARINPENCGPVWQPGGRWRSEGSERQAGREPGREPAGLVEAKGGQLHPRQAGVHA